MKSTMSSVIAMQTTPSNEACWDGTQDTAAASALRSRPCLTCLVSSAGSSAGGFSLDTFMDAEASAQRSRSREEAVSSCRVPHTLVQVGRIRDVPGGQQAIAISQVSFSRASWFLCCQQHCACRTSSQSDKHPSPVFLTCNIGDAALSL